jgi:two-component system OmpR family sensor kinase
MVWGTNNPVVYMRAGMSWVVLLLTLLLVLPLALGLWWRQRQQAREEALTAAARTEMAEDRRRFLQRLDHELKNPITAVRAGLVNVSGAASDEGRQKALNSMESQMVRLSRLTADLRKIAELETRTVEQVAVDLPELLDEVVEFVREHPNSEDKSIKLSVPNAPWPLPALRGDWDLLFLAVYNLVDNALKFSGPGDTVELRARDDGRFVILEVADTGPGIEAGEQPYVWEELYRGTAAGGVTGSGLGLSLVKAVAERHQGRVELHSRPGQGTLVSMVLPVAERV